MELKANYHALPHYVHAIFARFKLSFFKYEFQQLLNIIPFFC